MSFELDVGRQGGGPQAWSSPVDEFGFWDREAHTEILAPPGDGSAESSQFADVASVGRGGHTDREVVDVGDHNPSRDCHV